MNTKQMKKYSLSFSQQEQVVSESLSHRLMQLFSTTMIGTPQWMPKLPIEPTESVELRMFGSIDWWRRGLSKSELFKEHNKNKMCNQQFTLEGFSKEISSNLRRLWSYSSIKVRLMPMWPINSWTRAPKRRKRPKRKRVNYHYIWRWWSERQKRAIGGSSFRGWRCHRG